METRNENPNTALISETESEPSSPKRKKKKKTRRFQPNFNIPGVHKIILPEPTQQVIGCVVGNTVTVEKPWIHIEKDLIHEHLDAHTESSEFLPIKNEILAYPGQEFFMGYIPDESREYDEFYICTTEDATDAVKNIVQKLKKIQDDRLNNAVHRKIKEWKPLGSEAEIEEAMVKNHRSLIEVEIESKYPILPFKVQFRLVKTENLRDGYMELRPTDETQNTLVRKRIDAEVQVAPKVQSNDAQTVYTYPKHSYTQYDYEVPKISFDTSEKAFNTVMSENLDAFCDILRVNGTIDLYSNDYENLVTDEKFTMKVVLPAPKEYYCFIDMNLSGNKMISNITWHPMWTGCAVAAYVDVAPSLYLKTKNTVDEVFKAIHDSNPVLFWSFNDNLKPKLILETPRPIYTLSCCPYDSNLIIGGCVNGQIILWDITNKLHNVEEDEILNVNQQKYREYMFFLMNWMKNIFDLALVRPTALSNLQYSHRGAITHISWLSPCHKTSKTGKLEVEEKSQSLEFLTAAEDGTIMIWDLLKKPTIVAGGFKAVRKLKRLKKRPSALLVSESPFKMLHLNLKPVYKINLVHPETSRPLGISSCFSHFFKTNYEAEEKNSKSLKLSERLTFKPNINIENSSVRKTFYAGTIEGDYIQAQWDGLEFDLGEVVNFEFAMWLNFGKYHDGPVVSVDYAPTNDTILTVGGKIFALWRESFKNKPILWRKSSNIYTYGSWSIFDNSTINLTRMDGYKESWTLFYQSNSPLNVQLMSNGAVNFLSTHPRKLINDVMALCDYRGSLRLFCSKHVSPNVIKTKEESMCSFITNEIERKNEFLQWQENWNHRYKSRIDLQGEKETEVVTNQKTDHKKKDEKKKIQTISAGQRYLQSVQEEQKLSEQERIKSIILMKKQLDTEDLLKKREPLRKLEEESEAKKKRQKNKLKESDKIFHEQVAMLFPDVVKVKPVPPPDPYEDSYIEPIKKDRYNSFHGVAIGAQDYVEEHPFSYSFRWSDVLKAGRDRRKKLDENLERDNHRLRYEAVKATKGQETGKTESVEQVKTENIVSTTVSKDTISIA